MSPALIALLVQFGLQYGPEAVQALIAVIKNPVATVDDVDKAFANLKPYDAYQIKPLVA